MLSQESLPGDQVLFAHSCIFVLCRLLWPQATCCGSPNTAPWTQMLCWSHLQASTREEVDCSPPALPWRTQPCLWRTPVETGDAESGETLKAKALTLLTTWKTNRADSQRATGYTKKKASVPGHQELARHATRSRTAFLH